MKNKCWCLPMESILNAWRVSGITSWTYHTLSYNLTLQLTVHLTCVNNNCLTESCYLLLYWIYNKHIWHKKYLHDVYNHGSLVKDMKIDDLILARVGLDKLKLENPIKKHSVKVNVINIQKEEYISQFTITRALN